MGHSKNTKTIKTDEVKQAFLSAAITDMATWIQASDTKVSIIMGAHVALIAGAFACNESLSELLSSIKPCSWIGMSLVVFALLLLGGTIGVFLFGILTIRGHASIIDYKSKWFIPQNVNEYSFEVYKHDLIDMTDIDVIENMAAELYKLNDINRQKSKTMKWVIRSFAVTFGATIAIGLLILINIM